MNQTLDMGRFPDAAFANQRDRVFDEFAEAQGGVEIGLHGFEIAVVDAEKGVVVHREAGQAADLEQGIEVMHFQQDGEGQGVSQNEQVHEQGGEQGFGDEQDGIGPGSPGFVDLVGIDDKVFAQDGQCGNLFNLREIGQMALEEGFIGKDAEASAPADS